MEQKTDNAKQRLNKEPSKEMLSSLDLLEKFELVRMMKDLKVMKPKPRDSSGDKEKSR